MEYPLAQKTTSALLALCSILDKALDLERALQDLLHILSRELSTTRALAIVDDSGAYQPTITVATGISPSREQQLRDSLNRGLATRRFQSAEPFQIRPPGAQTVFFDTERARNLKKHEGSFIGVPVLLEGATAGLIIVDRLFPSQVPCGEDIRFLKEVAAVIARFISLNQTFTRREKLFQQEVIRDARRRPADEAELELTGSSPAMQSLRKDIERVARSRTTVLIQGEPGTGKTRIARLIHQLSGRAGQNFVIIDCPGLEETPMETPCLEHDRTVLPHATFVQSTGFRKSLRGTLYLKDVGELSLTVQARVLEAIQEQNHERSSNRPPGKGGVRILASTRRDLAAMCSAGAFRPDLYYRLNVFPLQVRPLRERPQDIPELAHHFLKVFNARYGRRLCCIENPAIEALKDYAWPGNVKEVKNLMERLVILSGSDRIELELVQDQLRASQASQEVMNEQSGPEQERGRSLQETERSHILAALKRNAWSQSRAAADLGISPRQMGYRVKKFGLKPVIAGAKADLRRKGKA